jgi:hypothetical protein
MQGTCSMVEHSMLTKLFQSEQQLNRFESELHLLEVETFEIEEIVDLEQPASSILVGLLPCSCCSESCSACTNC